MACFFLLVAFAVNDVKECMCGSSFFSVSQNVTFLVVGMIPFRTPQHDGHIHIGSSRYLLREISKYHIQTCNHGKSRKSTNKLHIVERLARLCVSDINGLPLL
jgi:hypothetical protein